MNMIKKLKFLLVLSLLVPQTAGAFNKSRVAKYLLGAGFLAGSYYLVKKHYAEDNQPITYKNITIYPLFDAQKVIKNRKNYVTLSEASKKEWITVKEVNSGIVNTVKIKNTGNEPVFILGGSIITGAKQDRTTQKDMLLPAHSGWTEIPVFCVEHHRWHHVSPEFNCKDIIIPSSLRKTAAETESQSDVWNKISSLQESAGIKSGTGTIVDNYKDKNTQKELDAYVKNLFLTCGSSIGIAVFIGDKLTAIELFSSNQLLRKFWNKLIKSYAMDAILAKHQDIPLTRNPEQIIGAGLGAIKNSPQTTIANPGLGTLVKLESHKGKGSALINGKTEFLSPPLVHLSYFPTLRNSDLTWKQWLNKYWWLPPVAGTAFVLEAIFIYQVAVGKRKLPRLKSLLHVFSKKKKEAHGSA